MMKAIVALAFFIAVAFAQHCVFLEKTDARCGGHQALWPIKVCNNQTANVTSSTACDADIDYTNWAAACPLKNIDNATFCEGNGFQFPGVPSFFCNAEWVGCSNDTDCETVVAPTAPVSDAPTALPHPFCYECCLFCFNETECEQKIAEAIPFYTNSTTCTPCFPEPVASPQNSGSEPSATSPDSTGPVATPSKLTPRPSTPRTSSAAYVVASASLIVAATLLI